MGLMSRAEAERLENEDARASLTSVRQGWDASAVAAALTPRQLAMLTASAAQGDMRDYLTLAMEMEERDLVFGASLATRKLAVVGLEPTVIPASDSRADQRLADEVRRDIVDQPQFPGMVMAALDAIAKGFSAQEIMWRTDRTPWRPDRYEHRDPRWFEYDQETGRKLMLLDESAQPQPLAPFKWLVHEPELRSGLPIRRGLALPASYCFLVKTSSLASWAAFCEVFGYPMRIGKYSRNATEADQAVLKRAVANLGRDLGAILPDDMVVDVVNGISPGGSIEHYERLANWCNSQIEIGVLGQTATTQGTPGRLGADVAQDRVRSDLTVADARQVGASIQAQVVQPYVDLNHGVQEIYPTLRLPVPRHEDIKAVSEAVSKLVPVGLRVRQTEVRRRLGFSDPDPGDAVLEAPAAPAASAAPATAVARYLAAATATAAPRRRTDVEADLDGLIEGRNWEPIVRPLYDAVQEWADRMGSLAEAEERLPELLRMLDNEQAIEQLAADLLRARGLGDLNFSDRTS